MVEAVQPSEALMCKWAVSVSNTNYDKVKSASILFKQYINNNNNNKNIYNIYNNNNSSAFYLTWYETVDNIGSLHTKVNLQNFYH